MGRVRSEMHEECWEMWSLRWEVIAIEPAGHQTAALPLAGFDAAIEGRGIVFGNRYSRSPLHE